MSQELHYTSVPRGLKPGSRGFCTVGLTPHMPGPLVERLEALSGYQPVFPPHDPSAPLNPIVFSHLRLTISGKLVSVLSRIGPAGLDYSGRPNKYAHHVVLEGPERPVAGPAWLLTQPGFMQGAWQGDPREMPSGRTPPPGDQQPGVARAWQALIGDGGWAGVLAETFLADPRRTVFLVFRPGMNLLPLVVEALALLPASRRWEVDFSTYFNQLPQGVGCAWRGVLEGSEDTKNARRLPNALVVDLRRAQGRAEGGALVHLARTGERVVSEPGTTTAPPGSGRHIPRMPREGAVTAIDPVGPAGVPPVQTRSGHYDLLPELARLLPGGGMPAPFESHYQRHRRRTRSWALAAVLMTACLMFFAVAVLFVRKSSVTPPPKSSRGVAPPSEGVAKGKKIAEAETAEKEPQAELVRPRGEQNLVANAVPAVGKGRNPPGPAAPPKLTESDNPKPSEPEAKRIVDEEPAVLFFPLPSIQKSGLGGKSAAEPKPFQLQGPSDHIALKYYVDNFDIKFMGDEDRIEIWTKSASEYGKLRLALFTKKAGELYFSWSEGARQSERQAELLRDGILTITAKDAPRYYILFRGSKIDDKRPLSLSPGTQKLMSDDLKPRNLPLEWTKNDSLAGTKWPLGIRKWKISSALPNGQSPKVIASGDEPTLPTQVKKYIIPKEVWVSLEIDSKEPSLIRVLLNFEKERVIRRRADTLRLQQLESQKSKTKVESEEMTRLQEILLNVDAVTDMEKHLSPPFYATLSVIIGLRIDKSTVLNIGKVGEFATSSH